MCPTQHNNKGKKSLSSKKSPAQGGLTAEFYHTFKEEMISTIFKVLKKHLRGSDFSKHIL
jgi:hypothetical protein